MPATFRLDDANSNSYARFPVQVRHIVTTFDPVDTTTAKIIVTGDTTVLGSKISKILVTSTSTDNTILFYLHNGTINTALPIFFNSIPANSGDGSMANKVAVNVIRSTTMDPIVDLDNNGNPYLMLSPGWSLSASMLTTIEATKMVQISIWIDDY